ncbi:MAG: hypothetical protein JSR39_02395 [Verrucomicrobia bacterium]|nr:hypothetical protein [Verrucomicrobiota bacterium]
MRIGLDRNAVLTFALTACFSISSFSIYGADEASPSCNTGNLALPSSQQPGPLISFGQNVIDQNQTQVFVYADDFIGKSQHAIDLGAGLTYGITDDFCATFTVPFAVSYKENSAHSSGLEDIVLQLEYAVYSGNAPCSSDQVTIVANASFPTGSSSKNPPTGFGSVGYFIGTTYNHTGVYWFVFTSYGAEFPTTHHGTKSGNQYLYQFGIGRNITNTKDWMIAWMAEVDGTFEEKDKVKGLKDPNSGGNVIYLTPSLWASSKNWIIQLGFGFAVQQNLFGNQNRNKYLPTISIQRTF